MVDTPICRDGLLQGQAVETWDTLKSVPLVLELLQHSYGKSLELMSLGLFYI